MFLHVVVLIQVFLVTELECRRLEICLLQRSFYIVTHFCTDQAGPPRSGKHPKG